MHNRRRPGKPLPGSLCHSRLIFHNTLSDNGGALCVRAPARVRQSYHRCITAGYYRTRQMISADRVKKMNIEIYIVIQEGSLIMLPKNKTPLRYAKYLPLASKSQEKDNFFRDFFVKLKKWSSLEVYRLQGGKLYGGFKRSLHIYAPGKIPRLPRMPRGSGTRVLCLASFPYIDANDKKKHARQYGDNYPDVNVHGNLHEIRCQGGA
jgi:hypothetical protein